MFFCNLVVTEISLTKNVYTLLRGVAELQLHNALLDDVLIRVMRWLSLYCCPRAIVAKIVVYSHSQHLQYTSLSVLNRRSPCSFRFLHYMLYKRGTENTAVKLLR